MLYQIDAICSNDIEPSVFIVFIQYIIVGGTTSTSIGHISVIADTVISAQVTAIQILNINYRAVYLT